MDLALDVTGRSVLIVGEAGAARRVLRRYRSLGAGVTHVGDVRAHGDAARSAAWNAQLRSAELVVSVGLPPAQTAELGAKCRALRIWHTAESAAPPPRGSVTLVGGGPGRRDLLTLGAIDALRNADVVFYDRLAPHGELAALAPGAELVNVGKQPGHHPVAQCDIESLMIERALAGNDVVRLKGGDPYVFGRGGEEVLACRAAGVPVRVISGVTSAIAVPAAAGIPVTQRELSHAFTVISGHAPLAENELAALAGLGGTIIVLMGVATLPQLSAGLTRHGMKADMPMAIVEQGYSSGQRTTVATLGTIVPTALAIGAKSPAVIVIGEVVRLAHDDDARAMLIARAEHAAATGATTLATSW